MLETKSSPSKMTDMKGSTSEVKDIHSLHKEWDAISCPICMDHPHNAVLIICSSHQKGCRSYICDTSYRHSNCLDRFKKLKANNVDNNLSQHSSSFHNDSNSRTRRNLAESRDVISTVNFLGALEGNSNIQGDQRTVNNESNCLKCPLCRGNVLGFMIINEVRQYLDLKPRSCSRESCSFFGTYRELRRHARRVHPLTRPADVDPSRQRAWRQLEHQSQYGDVLSALRSEMPGAFVLGDYVIDTGDNIQGEGSGQLLNTLFLLPVFDSSVGSRDEPRGSSRSWRTHRRSSGGSHYHRNLWGENLLGSRRDEADGYLDDDRPIPRRRRRFMRYRPDEEQP